MGIASSSLSFEDLGAIFTPEPMSSDTSVPTPAADGDTNSNNKEDEYNVARVFGVAVTYRNDPAYTPYDVIYDQHATQVVQVHDRFVSGRRHHAASFSYHWFRDKQRLDTRWRMRLYAPWHARASVLLEALHARKGTDDIAREVPLSAAQNPIAVQHPDDDSKTCFLDPVLVYAPAPHDETDRGKIRADAEYALLAQLHADGSIMRTCVGVIRTPDWRVYVLDRMVDM